MEERGRREGERERERERERGERDREIEREIKSIQCATQRTPNQCLTKPNEKRRNKKTKTKHIFTITLVSLHLPNDIYLAIIGHR